MKELPAGIASLFATETPAALGPERRPGVLSVSEIDAALKGYPKREPLRATLYLWHDHLDASHHIAQEIDTADGSLIHAIMHRREPDYWNSKYWFRRVGQHPAFDSLTPTAAALLRNLGEEALARKLLPGDRWDPFAFVDLVEASTTGGMKDKQALFQQLQRLEFEALLGTLV